MTQRTALVLWLIGSTVVGGGAALFICLASLHMRREPLVSTFAIIAIATGALVWLAVTWRFAKRFKRQ